MIDVFFVDEQVILATTALMPSVMVVMNLATLHRTALTYPSLMNTTSQRWILSRHQYTHSQRDRSHSYYGPRYRRHFIRSQSCHHSHCNRSRSFRRHTSHSSSSHHSSSLHPLANGWPHHNLHHDTDRNSHTSSHTHHRCHSFHSTDQIWSHSSNFHCTAEEPQPIKHKQCPRPSTPPRNLTTPKLSPSRILLQILHQIQTVTLIL